MLEALGSSLRDYIKKEFEVSITIEGVARDGWILLDVSDVMVHIFSPQQRDYYRLEQLWNKGKSLVTLQ